MTIIEVFIFIQYYWSIIEVFILLKIVGVLLDFNLLTNMY